MSRLNEAVIDQLFLQARTHSHWQARDIEKSLLQELYALMSMGPTSVNSSPARLLFVTTTEAKSKLLSAIADGNLEQTRTAPVTVILGSDQHFYEYLPTLFPFTDARSWFVNNEALASETAMRNSSLQGAYLIMAARSLGLDVGPMSGFDAAKVDQLFFAGTTIKTNFLLNIGYGDSSKLHPRAPRLAFAEAASIL